MLIGKNQARRRRGKERWEEAREGKVGEDSASAGERKERAAQQCHDSSRGKMSSEKSMTSLCFQLPQQVTWCIPIWSLGLSLQQTFLVEPRPPNTECPPACACPTPGP